MDTNKIIQLYTEGFSSHTSRYVLFRELIQANSTTAFHKWTPDIGVKYIRAMDDRGLSPGSIKTKALRIRRFFNWAIQHKYFKSPNPIELRNIPKFRDDRSPQALTEAEVSLMLKQIPRATFIGCRDRAAIALMLVHGFRIQTVCNMKWSDLEKRGDTYYMHARSKGNVLTARPLRPDVAQQLLKLHSKTFETSK